MIRRALLAMALAVPAIADADIYRCQGPDGSTTFSDSRCGDRAERVEIREQFEEPGAEATVRAAERRVERARRAYERRQREQRQRQARALERSGRQVPGVSQCPSSREIREAIREHRPLPCMTRSEVLQAEPEHNTTKNRYNELLSSGITVETWTYTRRWHDWPPVIRFRAGRVAAVEGFLD